MEQEFEKLLNKLVASTRSPKGQFSKANSWLLLEKRLPRLHIHTLLRRIATTAAVIITICTLSWWIYNTFVPAPLQTVSTLAESRTILLPDQSKVILNHYSSITYPKRFKSKDRKVLLQGEAYFEVAKDALHPFKVEAGDIMVQVLGTHFNVEAYPKDIQIKTTLLEGSVAINLIGKAEKRMVLIPNESAIYNKVKKELTRHTEKNASGKVLWRNGTLLFENAPMKEIARRLSNTYHIAIQITDIQIQNYHMTATFSNNESLEEILSLLCRNQNFKYTKTNNTIFITQKLN